MFESFHPSHAYPSQLSLRGIFLFVRLGVRAGYGNKLHWFEGISVLFVIHFSLFTKLVDRVRRLGCKRPRCALLSLTTFRGAWAFLYYSLFVIHYSLFVKLDYLTRFLQGAGGGIFCADLRGCGGFQLDFTLV